MNIYIHGSFMNDNYGDFLLYYVAKNTVEDVARKNDKVYSSDVDKSYDKYTSVRRRSKFSAIFESDAVVFAGGGYFGEPNKHKIYWNIRCLWKHLLPAFLIALRRTPFVVVGVEVGPLSFRLSRCLMKYIATHAEVISVRNEESKVFLRDIGVKRDIGLNPDWIMGVKKSDLLKKLNKKQLQVINDINSNMKRGDKTIAVHLTGNPDGSSMSKMVDDLRKYGKSEKVTYVIVCDQARKKQAERAAILQSKLSGCKSSVVLYDGPWLLTAILDTVDVVMTDKLHVGIVATLFGKEVISVALHPKTGKFYRLIGRESWTLPIEKVKSGDVLKRLKGLSFKNNKIDNKIVTKARQNQIIVKNFIKEK